MVQESPSFFRHPTMLALTLLSIGLAAGSAVQGDHLVPWYQGPTEAATFDVQQVLDVAKAMDPVEGAALEQAFLDGELDFVEFNHEFNSGIHDHNTIGLNPDCGLYAMAAAALHEWEHVRHCNGPTGAPGGGDARVGDPCYKCIHAQMTADSWTALNTYICTTSHPCTEEHCVSVPCAWLVKWKQAAQQQMANCPATCNAGTFEDLAAWEESCEWCE